MKNSNTLFNIITSTENKGKTIIF